MEHDLCMAGAGMDAEGRWWYPCGRAPAPGRQLCAKHARYVDRVKARRRKNRAARRHKQKTRGR